MLIATTTELAERREAIAREPVLSRLAQRVRARLQPLLDRPLFVSDRKAMLSQDGGTCPDDGSRLAFDPFSPESHVCPGCRRAFTGERHHLAWLMRYHLWLSERAVHLALLGALGGDAGLTTQANAILTGYAERYRGYPNRDNVLGPTRLFFSTYLESIWLVQCSIAASLTGVDIGAMLGESASIVRSFDEGWSNRQVWNNAAMIAVGRVLDDKALVTHGVDGSHGVRGHIRRSVSSDGFWFEGQNYHFFALRGLQLAAELLRGAGTDLYGDAEAGPRLSAMYTAPLLSLLPDLTIPARSDSPYGVSVRQPRFAELWELARVRTDEPRLSSLLAELYREGAPEADDPGATEISEVEQNRPPARLHRDRLGWKALLWMDPAEPVSTASWEPESALSPEHGLAVMRSPGRYVSVECGGRPGGHGHPDLLHLTLYWDEPWLMDFGTGSYVSPSLFWYRSTLAHNAPGIAGLGQTMRDGHCDAFDSSQGWSWCSANAEIPGGTVSRTVIAGPAYVLDMILSTVGNLDLPMHPMGELVFPSGVTLHRTSLAPGRASGHETGYDRLVRSKRVEGEVRQVTARRGPRNLVMTMSARPRDELYVAAAPGPPDLSLADGAPLEFLVRRNQGPPSWVHVYALDRNAVRSVETSTGEVRVSLDGGKVDVFRFSRQGVRVESGSAIIALGGVQPRPERTRPTTPHASVEMNEWLSLSRAHYRRSEEEYDAERFQASVKAHAFQRELAVGIRVKKAELVFRQAADPDPRLDNEPPDIHSDGVQFYVGEGGWQGYLLVPVPESKAVRVLPVRGTAADPERVSAGWLKTPDGYHMTIRFDLGRDVEEPDAIPFNVVINEMTPGRQRRTGQLALSGGGWVYLRGDRESPESAVVLEVK